MDGHMAHGCFYYWISSKLVMLVSAVMCSLEVFDHYAFESTNRSSGERR